MRQNARQLQSKRGTTIASCRAKMCFSVSRARTSTSSTARDVTWCQPATSIRRARPIRLTVRTQRSLREAARRIVTPLARGAMSSCLAPGHGLDGRGGGGWISLRLMPGPDVPFPPMEAQLVDELPRRDGWQYEPKWDGFRGVLENDGGELALWSRNGRPLLRYFPELRELAGLLPPHSALDGEIVIAQKGQLDFDAMQMRLHPAESRVRKLAADIPAEFIAFDVL